MKLHILAALAAFHASAATAQECNPIDFLKPETLQSTTDLTTRISYVDAYHRQNEGKRAGKFMSDVFLPWGIGDLDERQSKVIADLIKSFLNLQIDERQQDWLLVSTLSRTGINEYRDCLQSKKKPFSVTFSGNPMLSSSFFLQVMSHPAYSGQKTLPMKLQTINGSISRPGVQNMSGKIETRTMETVPILRDLTKPLKIHLTVGPDEDFVTVPAVPARTIVAAFRTGEKFNRRVKSGEQFGPTPYCVRLADEEQDAFIIPGTIRLHFTERSSSKEGEAIDCQNASASHPACKGDMYKHKESANLREVCAYLSMQATEKDSFASAAGYAQAQVAKAVSMSGPSPSASPPASSPK
jgi:hypothetical protein